jgi:hypothetical protein
MESQQGTTKNVTLRDIHLFFKGDDASFTLKAFREQWEALTDSDKAQIKVGMGDGSFTY